MRRPWAAPALATPAPRAAPPAEQLRTRDVATGRLTPPRRSPLLLLLFVCAPCFPVPHCCTFLPSCASFSPSCGRQRCKC